jgi:ketosteroid isomerase-like protein
MINANIRTLADELETKKWNLLLAGDADGLASLSSTDLYYMHSSGLKDDKSSYLDQLQDGTFLYHRIEHHIEDVNPLGEHAFFTTGIVKIDARVKGIERQMHSRVLSIWRREGAEWKLIAQQTTAAPDDCH